MNYSASAQIGICSVVVTRRLPEKESFVCYRRKRVTRDCDRRSVRRNISVLQAVHVTFAFNFSASVIGSTMDVHLQKLPHLLRTILEATI